MILGQKLLFTSLIIELASNVTPNNPNFALATNNQVSVQNQNVIKKEYNQPIHANELDLLKIQEESKEKLQKLKENEKKECIARILNDCIDMDLTIPSGLDAKTINKLLEGTNLSGLGEAFENAENQYSVNAYYLIAHACWESGWGTSELAINKNNLYGFTAYDDDPYWSAKSFSSKADCINTVAKFISEQYLKKDGKYYNGPNLIGINVDYASDKNWANGVGDIMKELAIKVQNLEVPQ